MAKLLLHVGSHKTGTTTIQHFLAGQRPYLRSNGVYYPDVRAFFGGRSEAHHKVAHSLSSNCPEQRQRLQAFRGHLKHQSERYDLIVLSAEPFYRLVMNDEDFDETQKNLNSPHAARRAYLDNVADYFSDFDTEILLYLRRPDRFAEAIYKSSVVNTEFCGGFAKSRTKKSFRYKYRYQIDEFGARFGKIHVHSYEDAANAGLLIDFFGALGIPAPPRTVAENLRSSVNDLAALWIDRSKQKRSLSLTDVRDRWLFAIGPSGSRVFATDEETTLWQSKSERDAFYHQYADDVHELTFRPLEPHLGRRAVWDEDQHARAESQYQAWRNENDLWLHYRHGKKLLPYMQDDRRESDRVGNLDQRTRVAVCSITLNRPKQLNKLMKSWASMQIPDDVDLFYVVVDNDRAGSSQGVVAEREGDLKPAYVLYEREPVKGIPIARNRAVSTALKFGAELILFVDDDETVDPRWLTELITAKRTTGAQLIGGPVYARIAQDAPDDPVSRLICDGVDARYERIAHRAQKYHDNGMSDQIVVVTNNWLADARLFKESNIWFDTKLRFTGGSDSKFFHKVSASGRFKTGWATKAIVYEHVPAGRLTPRYQFIRGMEQSRNAMHLKLEQHSRLAVLPALAVNVVYRSFGLLLLFLSLPLTRGSGLVRILRSSGWLVGRLSAMFGAKSSLYKRANGTINGVSTRLGR